MTKCRQLLLTISVEIDDELDTDRIEEFVDELDYNIISKTNGIDVVTTEIVDYEEIETCRINTKEIVNNEKI